MQIRLRQWAQNAIQPQSLSLPVDEIHVWWRRIEGILRVDSFRELLSDDEGERANRYRIEAPREEFIVTRGTLRLLLASYLGVGVGDVVFEYSAQGKPALKRGLDAKAPRIQFNVSHSRGLAVLAFVKDRDIGVDVEKLHEECETAKLAERFFSPRERQFVSTLRGEELQATFFRCWTRKEAYIKAKGGGLSIPLHQFDVSLAENEPAALLATRPEAEEAARWKLYDLAVDAAYAGALAVSAPAETRLR